MDMILTINTKDFIDCLAIGASMAGKQKTDLILSCIKVDVEKGFLNVISTDKETTTTKKCQYISSTEDGSFCVMAKDIIDIVNAIPDEEIKLEVNEDTCNIIYNKGSLSLPKFSAEDFPSSTQEESVCNIKIPAKTLYSSIKKANLFSAISEEEDVELKITEKNIILETDSAYVNSLKVVGKYPNAKSIMLTECLLSLEVNKTTLKETINRALLAANTSSKCLKILIPDDNYMVIQSEDLGFNKKCSEKIPCIRTGTMTEEFRIGVNGEILNTCLKGLDSDTVVIRFNSPKRAFEITESVCPNKKIIAMPVTIV